jgi:hypothetical protein
MARDNQKTPTPAPEAALATESQAPAKKKFSFSFDFFRKDSSKAFGKGSKEFAGKVAPSKRELEARAAKRRAQKAKMQGIKQQPTPVESEETEKQLQPA